MGFVADTFICVSSEVDASPGRQPCPPSDPEGQTLTRTPACSSRPHSHVEHGLALLCTGRGFSPMQTTTTGCQAVPDVSIKHRQVPVRAQHQPRAHFSWTSPSDRGRSCAASTQPLALVTAGLLRPAILPARARASGSSCSNGSTLLTRPHCRASWAEILQHIVVAQSAQAVCEQAGISRAHPKRAEVIVVQGCTF